MGEYKVYNKRTIQIISCFGKIKQHSVAKMFGVSPIWVGTVWRREGLTYDAEDFIEGYF